MCLTRQAQEAWAPSRASRVEEPTMITAVGQPWPAPNTSLAAHLNLWQGRSVLEEPVLGGQLPCPQARSGHTQLLFPWCLGLA